MATYDSPGFGDLLRQRRRKAGLTQEALAERAGISVRAIADLERGAIRAPRRDTLEMLAGALALTPDEHNEWAALRRQLSVRRAPSSVSEPAARHALPHPANPLVGRHHEIDALGTLLTQPHVQLVTVTGPGGVGKTRLALETAAQFGTAFCDGVRCIELAAIRDPDLVLAVIARGLGVQSDERRALADRLTTFLAPRELLLLLDNFEHLLNAAAHLAQLLASTPKLRMLVTSRARLQLQAEYEFPLSPLGVPEWDSNPPMDQLERYPAAELFIQRSRQVDPAFTITTDNASAIAAICSHLDGLPLAIELAAARTKVLSPQEILPRLVNRLAFLTGGLRDAPDRHRTMRGAIAWNYDLLTDEEQQLFRHLAVFVGGWTLDAAEATAPGDIDVIDTLVTLIDHSLVTQSTDPEGRSRFGMLETIREFGLEQLEARGELEQARRRHACYFLQLAEAIEPRLLAAMQSRWFSLLADELPNVRAALAWSQRPAVDPDFGLRLCGSLAWFWRVRGYASEGRQWLECALAREASSPEARMKALAGAGWIAHVQQESAAARQLLDESLALAEELDDRWTRAWVLHLLGRVAYFDGDAATARKQAEQSLGIARDLEDDWLVGWALHLLGLAAHIDDDFPAARQYYQASLEIREALGDQEGLGVVTGLLGMLALREGDHATALRLLHESLGPCRELGSPWLVVIMVANIVTIATTLGEPHRAARLTGFIAAASEAGGAGPIPIAAEAFQRGVELTRAALTPDEFEKDWTEGQRMTLEEAVNEALRVGCR